MSLKEPPSTAEMKAMLKGLNWFEAQQKINGWYRAYGVEAVREIQKEIDHRRKK